jgi:hypothetical protein
MSVPPTRVAIVLLALGLLAETLEADTLVLRNGRQVRGRVVAIRGTTIEFEDARDGRTQRVDRRDVRRIEFDEDEYGSDYTPGGPGDAWYGGTGGTPPSGMREREVLAYANAPWSDTGINVRQGQIVYFRARGEVRWGRNRRDGPEGESNSPRNPNRPIPGRPGAALIGKVGENSTDVFFIGGDTGPVRMRSAGRLYLGINDDYLQDNAGFFTVVVSY